MFQTIYQVKKYPRFYEKNPNKKLTEKNNSTSKTEKKTLKN